MSGSIADSHVIRDSAAMWVLASPVRLEVLEAACALGRCSAGELAEMTGRSRTSLYPHIEQLAGAGLLIEDGTRPRGKRQEQLYRPIARRIYTKHDAGNADVVRYHISYGRAVCRMMARLFESAISHPEAITNGEGRDTYCGSQTLWADDSTLRELNEHIERIWEICSESQPGEGRKQVRIGMIVGPAARARPGKPTPGG